MAIYNESWIAADEMDYEVDSSITRADARKGFAARITRQQENARGRPQAGKTNAASQVIIGAITHVGKKGCKVVKKGRFVLQAVNAYDASTDFGKVPISTTTAGKVDAGTADAGKGDLAIVGGGNDTATDGIGEFYLIECL